MIKIYERDAAVLKNFKAILQKLLGSRIFITTTGQGEEDPHIQFEGRLVGIGVDFIVIDINGFASGIIRIAEIVEIRRAPVSTPLQSRSKRKTNSRKSFVPLRGKREYYVCSSD